MLLLRLGVNQNVIQIYHHKLIEILHENRVHEPREGGRCVGETEGHDRVLVQAIAGGESCFRNIFLANLDLMITTSQVKLREYHSSSKLIEEIINPRKGIFILDGFSIERPIVHTKSISLVSLLHKDGWATPRRGTVLNETQLLLLIKLTFEFSQLRRTHFIRPLGDRRGSRFKLNYKLNLTIRRHTWQLFRKDIWELTDHRNTLNSFHSIIIQSRQRVKLNRRSQTWRKDYMAFRNLQRNRAFSTINHSCICCQPIHAQDDINVRIAQKNQGCRERRATNLNLIAMAD